MDYVKVLDADFACCFMSQVAYKHNVIRCRIAGCSKRSRVKCVQFGHLMCENLCILRRSELKKVVNSGGGGEGTTTGFGQPKGLR